MRASRRRDLTQPVGGEGYLSSGPLGRHWVRRLRPYAAATLLVFAWHSAQPWNFAFAAQAPPIHRPDAGELALQRWDRGLAGAAAAAQGIDPATAAERDLSTELARLERSWRQMEAADEQIRADFAAVGEHIRRAGLSGEILDRHEGAVEAYDAGMARLRDGLDAAGSAHRELRRARDTGRADRIATRSEELKASVRRLQALLADSVQEPRHSPLDPLRLPHRAAPPQRQDPRLDPERFSLPAITSAAGTARVLGLGAEAALPVPADLEPTVDAPLSQEIRDLAASLGNDPLRIFAHVRNEIDFTPTHGSIQGAQGCLRTRLCNDTDTASLLVALLRAAGVPARYALGTVEIPVEQVQNWVGGFTSPSAALDFVASSGTPVVGLTSGGSLVAARVEHVWVEAFLDYVPSRGAVTGTAGDTWVPLDPSFKQFTYTPGIDLATAAGVDVEAAFRAQLEAVTVADPDGGVTDFDLAGMQARLEETRDELRAFLDARPTPPSLDELAGGRSVEPQSLTAAPGSLPYRVLTRGGAVSTLPDPLRHRLRFEVFPDGSFPFTPDLVYETSLPELASRKLTLSYAPASAADEATLASFVPPGGDPTEFPSSLPAYLVRVKPELRIDGQVVAAGDGTTLGRFGQFRMTFREPGSGPRVVDNPIVAGTYNAVVLNLGGGEDPATGLARTAAVRDLIAAGQIADLTKDDVVGELLHVAGRLYWSELELFSRLAAGQQQVVTARIPSEGIFTYDLAVTFLFGTPRTVRSGALITDVDSDVQAIGALDGDRDKAIDFLAVGGALASRAESAIWDQLVNETPTGAGITAISYLEEAARLGIPIYHIDSSNVTAALADLQVSAQVKTDVRNAVAAGKIVTIPQRAFPKDGFQGVGYVVFDPETGAGGYLISGGLAGGGFQLPPLHPLLTFLLGVLLVGLGIFATGGLAVLLAVLAIALIAYDLISTIQNLDPNLSPEAREMIIAFLSMLAIVGAVLAIIGIFAGSFLAFVVFAVYWAFLSLLAAAIMVALATLIDRSLPLTAELRRRRRGSSGGTVSWRPATAAA